MSVQLDPSRTALLVLHLQRDIIENEEALGAVFRPETVRRNVVAQSGRLLERARSSGVLPVQVRVAFRADGSNLLTNLPLLQMSVGALIDGKPGSDFVDELAPQDGDIVVTHHRTNPFLGSDLDTILRKRSVDTVVLCGVATNVVVQTTAFGAADIGYRVVLAEDACSAATPQLHEAAVETLRLFAEVTSVDDVLKAL